MAENNTDGATISMAALEERVCEILVSAGFGAVQAAALARVVAAGERDGCKSHGLYRLDGMLASARAGTVDPHVEPVLLPDDGYAVVRVNAGFGFAPAALELGIPFLAERARSVGIAALVVNDCAHLSALWPEVEMLTERELAAIALCPSYATVAPAGGTMPLLGTNPFAFGWPRPGRDPYVFDFATSAAARGEIELHRRAGEPLPEGWALDSEGRPTTDPERALAGAMLPFGGHKGSAMGTMIELLGAVLIGDLTSRDCLDRIGTTTLAPVHGELLIAFAPEVFVGGRSGDPFARAEILFDAIVGQGARLPSQRRFAARARCQSEGIWLAEAEIAKLDALLAQDAGSSQSPVRDDFSA
ncbi:MAG TPA: Ldh family oxidoreductase [Amaricoccus sp.]|uniref:Ldh family oxidoreductase n=1 Tax=Amaricoccus sp. TaxID=1872485 RepID=UPI002BAA0D8D|nr:Ldh family oxidoreductase [Amaricoccus sp.]HMQ91656.1 Ldh family oxidoreductase [Amaricoccus sp.]HMR52241.1 Ldh family oxidoreductase [Amaricoccus sp.]HMT99093.1 Ldh family oxidoreductase [Amaricoccus sp.]